MSIKVQQINGKHKIFLLPQQDAEGKRVEDLDLVDQDGNKIKVLGHYTHGKDDFPAGLYHILVGREPDENLFWAKYSESEKIAIIIGE